MKRKRTVVSPSQLSVVEPSHSFFLEMLVFTVESLRQIFQQPLGWGGPEGGGGPGEQSLSTCERSAELLMDHKDLGSARVMGMGREGGRD